MGLALKALRVLTKRAKLVRVDVPGSVSGLELELETHNAEE